MPVLLLSTYDLGHHPFALASAAAHLRNDGIDVTCNDLAVDDLNEAAVAGADIIAIHLAMHTATRLSLELLPRLVALNNAATYVFFGLYAPMARELISADITAHFIGGEIEDELLRLVKSNDAPTNDVYMSKLRLCTPDRSDLPALDKYARLQTSAGEDVVTGYTEATRGCKHVCRHCPVVPVYGGKFFPVALETVIADIDQQVAAGARHISFGDPDFFNGPSHGLRVVREMRNCHPDLTYDAIIKVEHLLKHRERLSELKETGCLFITTAVESVDDQTLALLDKGHTRAEFIEAVSLVRDAGLTLSPTFIPFTPWTTLDGYRDLLSVIRDLGLIENVSPIQLVIRLLIPLGSRLLELDQLSLTPDDFDKEALSYTWANPDPAADRLADMLQGIVDRGESAGDGRAQIFAKIWQAAHEVDGSDAPALFLAEQPKLFVPRMSEPWYCCAEPSRDQLARV